MDNNFNQPDNQNEQNNNMFSNQNGGNGFGSFVNNVNNSMGVAEKPNIVLGSVGALVGAVVGAILWIVIAAFTGYVFFFLGVAISFLSMFLYYKLGKGIDIIGVIICMVLMCIAVYVGNRIGTVFAIANEWDYSYDLASATFDWNMDHNEAFQMDYVKTMVMSYIASIGYTIVMIVSRIKKRK